MQSTENRPMDRKTANEPPLKQAARQYPIGLPENRAGGFHKLFPSRIPIILIDYPIIQSQWP